MSTRAKGKQDPPPPAPVTPAAANDAPAESPSGQHTIVIDPDRAEHAWRTQSPRWPALSLQEATLPRRNVEYVAVRVAQAARGALTGPRRERFVAMPDLDLALVETVTPTAEALWYARLRYRQAEAGKTRAQLPAKLVDDGRKLRDHMWICADYNLGHLPAARVELDDIARVEGSVYLDLAMDLQRLAIVYTAPAWQPELAIDKRRYDPNDVNAARLTASTIIEGLASAEDATAYWGREIARGWAALEPAWVELSAAGRYLDRRDDPDARWPTLHAIVRARATAASDKGDAPADPPAEPAKPPTG